MPGTSSIIGPLNYKQLIQDPVGQQQNKLEQNVVYDWTVCPEPRTFGLDSRVQQGLLCLEVNSTLEVNPIIKQGKNIKYKAGSTQVSSMDFNLWPYSNCWDRSTETYRPLLIDGGVKLASDK